MGRSSHRAAACRRGTRDVPATWQISREKEVEDDRAGLTFPCSVRAKRPQRHRDPRRAAALFGISVVHVTPLMFPPQPRSSRSGRPTWRWPTRSPSRKPTNMGDQRRKEPGMGLGKFIRSLSPRGTSGGRTRNLGVEPLLPEGLGTGGPGRAPCPEGVMVEQDLPFLHPIEAGPCWMRTLSLPGPVVKAVLRSACLPYSFAEPAIGNGIPPECILTDRPQRRILVWPEGHQQKKPPAF